MAEDRKKGSGEDGREDSGSDTTVVVTVCVEDMLPGSCRGREAVDKVLVFGGDG